MLKNKWFKFVVLYLGATALSLSMIKLSPIQISMGLDVESYGLLTSVFTISALILAIPGGSLIAKYGPRKMALFIMGCLVVGNLMGAMAVNQTEVTNYPLLLISRVIEGISFSMINTIGMVFIGNWFADGGTGTAIGIFGTFSALASMVAMNLYLPIYRNFGMNSIWYFTALLCGIALVGFVFLLEDIKSDESTEEKSSYSEVMKDKNTWFMAIAMCTMTFVLYVFIAFYPRIFMDMHGMTEDASNSYTGLFGLFGAIFGFAAGILVDRFKIKPAILGVISAICMGVGCILILIVPTQAALIQLCLLTFGISSFSSSIGIAAPVTVKRPALLGQTFALIYQFYYIGVTVGPYVIGKILAGFGTNVQQGWIVSLITMTVISGVGTLCMILLSMSSKKKQMKA